MIHRIYNFIKTIFFNIHKAEITPRNLKCYEALSQTHSSAHLACSWNVKALFYSLGEFVVLKQMHVIFHD